MKVREALADAIYRSDEKMITNCVAFLPRIGCQSNEYRVGLNSSPDRILVHFFIRHHDGYGNFSRQTRHTACITPDLITVSNPDGTGDCFLWVIVEKFREAMQEEFPAVLLPE